MTTNHPAHGPVSLDRLHQISEILSKASAQSDGGNLGYAMADAVKVIDGAIAAFGAEPVAWLHSDNGIGIPAITRSRNVADSWFSKGWNIKPLYTAPPAPLQLPVQRWEELCLQNPDMSIGDAIIRAAWWNHCAAMLQAGNHTEQHLDMVDHSGDANKMVAANSPVTPDGYVLIPKKLTAENGAKSVLSGEFSETKFINCPECFGDDDCETCDGSGRIEITVPVTWTTIKAIWAKGVEHFAAAPQQENV